MAEFTPTQLAMMKMRYKEGRSVKYIKAKNGLTDRDISTEFRAILQKVGVTSQYAAIYELTKAGII